MVDWISGIPDVVWGAFVTGAFLTGQQVLNNGREDRRRKEDATEREKDRSHQRAESHDERRHQAELAAAQASARINEIELAQKHEAAQREADKMAARNDLWRDERREAHVALIPLFEEAIRRIAKGIRDYDRKDDDEDRLTPDTALGLLPSELQEQITAAVAHVQIIGSSQSRLAANTCRRSAFDLDVALWVATLVDSDTRSAKLALLRERLETLKTHLQDYIDAVRIDLGTSD